MGTYSLDSALSAIRRRPGMFFKTKSLSALATFLTGYHYGLDCADVENFPHGKELQEFSDWLHTRLGAKSGDWWEILVEHAGGDEVVAFDRFFELWDEHANDANRSE